MCGGKGWAGGEMFNVKAELSWLIRIEGGGVEKMGRKYDRSNSEYCICRKYRGDGWILIVSVSIASMNR